MPFAYMLVYQVNLRRCVLFTLRAILLAFVVLLVFNILGLKTTVGFEEMEHFSAKERD